MELLAFQDSPPRSANVGGRQNRAQMGRVHASTVGAEMVKVVPFWDRPHDHLVDHSVSEVRSPGLAVVVPEDAISGLSKRARPHPTRVGLMDLRPKAFLGRGRRVARIAVHSQPLVVSNTKPFGVAGAVAPIVRTPPLRAADVPLPSGVTVSAFIANHCRATTICAVAQGLLAAGGWRQRGQRNAGRTSRPDKPLIVHEAQSAAFHRPIAFGSFASIHAPIVTTREVYTKWQ